MLGKLNIYLWLNVFYLTVKLCSLILVFVGAFYSDSELTSVNSAYSPAHFDRILAHKNGENIYQTVYVYYTITVKVIS